MREPLKSPLPPEDVKKSGFGEMKDAAHVQKPEKFACQNKAVVSSLLAGDSTLAARLGRFVCTYMTLPQVARVPLRKPREPYCAGFLIPPILAARIFPSPGQREKPISLSTRIFSHLPPSEREG